MAGIEDKVVVITGASSGIGEATALLLAERGARVVLGARRADRLDALATRIGDAGGEVAHQVTDVRDRESVAALVGLAVERFGRLDVLVSNAGVATVGPIDDLDVDGGIDMVDVNVKGVLFGMAAALPVFLEQGSGHFVHTSSTSAYKTVAGQTVYSGTKAAVNRISEGLRVESEGRYRVTIVAPGFTDTDFVADAKNEQARAEMAAARAAIAQPPSALAEAVAYAIAQPDNVDVGEIVVRPTAQA